MQKGLMEFLQQYRSSIKSYTQTIVIDGKKDAYWELTMENKVFSAKFRITMEEMDKLIKEKVL